MRADDGHPQPDPPGSGEAVDDVRILRCEALSDLRSRGPKKEQSLVRWLRKGAPENKLPTSRRRPGKLEVRLAERAATLEIVGPVLVDEKIVAVGHGSPYAPAAAPTPPAEAQQSVAALRAYWGGCWNEEGVMRLWIALMFASVAAACSPLALFNTAVPKDPVGGRVAAGIPYGEGPRQRLDVYPAVGGREGPKPVVVFIYGGSWDSGRRQDYAWVGRALAAQGFLTVVPDYRLVPENPYPDFLADGAAAVRWTRDNAARFGGDGDRIVLMGHSAGAYNAVMLALDRRHLDQAGVPQGAIRGAVGLAGPYDFYPWDAAASRNAFGHWPEPLETQPVSYARADAPPLLLLHGDADSTVRPRNTSRLAARLAEAGGRATAKIYPGMDHRAAVLALSRPFRGRYPVLEDVVAFVRAETAR